VAQVTPTATPPTETDLRHETADRILEVVPRLMRRIRREMRVAGSNGLTVPQLRALLYVRRHPAIGLSPLAEHLGMSASATSGLVDRLVRSGMLDRATDPDERRRIQLTLSPAGREHVEHAHQRTRAWLSRELAVLEPDELERLTAALDVLRVLGRTADEPTRVPGGVDATP